MPSPVDEVIVAVSETAADALETPLEELPPLSNAIDPEALRTIVSSGTNALRPRVTVAFDYAGLEVVVSSDSMVYAQPIGSDQWAGKSNSFQ